MVPLARHRLIARVLGADAAVAGALAAAVGGLAFARSSMLPPALVHYWVDDVPLTDIWFDADIPKYTCLVVDRFAAQYAATSEHPLLGLYTYLPGLLFGGLALEPFTRARLVVALGATLWSVVFYAALRTAGHRLTDAAVFTVLAASSAAALFWMVAPELHLWGSLTLLLPLLAAGARRLEATSLDAALTAASAASLSATVTNWVAGLAGAWSRVGGRRALRISVVAFLLVSALWVVQRWWFPYSGLFVPSSRGIELMLDPDRSGPGPTLVSFFSHGVVMPQVDLVPDEQRLTVQHAVPGSSGLLGMAATAAWGALLVLGARQVARGALPPPVQRVLLVTLAAQLVLHLLVGRETFLYSMQFAPLLLIVATSAAFGRRRIALALTVVLIVAGAANNWRQFQRAAVMAGEQAIAAAAGVPFDREQCR